MVPRVPRDHQGFQDIQEQQGYQEHQEHQVREHEALLLVLVTNENENLFLGRPPSEKKDKIGLITYKHRFA